MRRPSGTSAIPAARDVFRAAAGNRLAAEGDLTAGDGDDSHDRVQRRRLAGTVCPDEPYDLAGGDLEAEAAHGVHGAVADVEICDDEPAAHVSASMPESPRYAAVTSRFALISAGVPSVSVRPWSST